MEFSEKTIICEGAIPLDVLTKQYLKLIVLSADENLVDLADNVAQQEPLGIDRIVVWVKNIDWTTIISQIPEIDNIDDCLAFSLSTINKIGAFITSGSTIDFIEFDSAFIEAGKTENN